MADGGQYWVDIYQGGAHLGAGFFITTRYVLTARHCLRRISRDDDTLDLHCPDGEVIPGKLYPGRPDADLALIELTKPKDSGISVPRPDLPRAGDVWTDPYRPSICDPYLTGSVVRPALAYQCEDGTSVEAIQLGCEQALGDYSGYSGSPIERRDDEHAWLLGILLEQYPDRENPDRYTSVLFAATVAEVLERFDYFGLGHFERILGLRFGAEPAGVFEAAVPKQGSSDRSPVGSKPAGVSMRAKLDEAEALMESLEDWVAKGRLDPDEVRVMASRIANSIVECGIAEMTR